MAYSNTKKMLIKAKKNGFAVGAFNFSNMETLQAIVCASEKLGKDVIVQASESAIAYAGADVMVAMVQAIAKKVKISVALHLDHGSSFEVCKTMIDAGFSSVMFDGSALSFEDNVNETKRVVEYAHSAGVTVEAELGKIIGVEDSIVSKEKIYTDPEEAYKFVKLTGVDSLAISIGTAHGVNKGTQTPKIRFDIIDAVDKKTKSLPLVAHGSSLVFQDFVDGIIAYGGEVKKAQGIPQTSIKKMAKSAICKINMDTDLRLCFTASVRKYLTENKTVFDPRKILGDAKSKTQEYVEFVTKSLLN